MSRELSVLRGDSRAPTKTSLPKYNKNKQVSFLLTKLAASIPEWLGVVVTRVHTVGRWIDAGQLMLVEMQILCWLLLQYLVGFCFTER